MTIENRLLSLKERTFFPILSGVLISPVPILAMFLIWEYWPAFAFVWTGLIALGGWPSVFWKTPLRKALSTAILIGTAAPAVVWLWNFEMAGLPV